MSKKSLLLGMIIGASITVIVGAIGISFFANNENTGTQLSDAIEEKLDTIDGLIDRFYLYEDELDDEKLADGIYNGYMSALEDPYTVYYNEEETKQLNEYMSGTYYGIGAVLSQNMQTGVVTVSECLENSGAEESGLKPYDVIVEVDGTDISGMLLENIVTLIKGDDGTIVKLTVYREGEEDYLYFDIERREIESPTVDYEVLDNNIGYIDIAEFEEMTLKKFEEAYADLMSQNVKGLIIDLRDNPGGLLSVVCDMCEHFVPKDGLIVYTEDKYGNKEELFADTHDFCTVPLVVLVNENSASASEIFSGAVKSYGSGKIVGTTTYGKGVVQKVVSLSDGTSIKLTISKYYTPNGEDIHGVGITPDIEVELDEELKVLNKIPHDKDTQLQAGIKEIEEECSK